MPNGKLLGIVTSRDYRVSRMSTDLKVRDFMTPREKLITAPSSTTLKKANDIIWEHKLNALPIVDENDCLRYFVFRKDYAEHKEHPLALQDAQKRYLVGAGITPATTTSASPRSLRRARIFSALTRPRATLSGRRRSLTSCVRTTAIP